MPAVRRPLGERRDGRAVAGRRPDAAAGGRACGRSATSSMRATTSWSSSASRSTRSTPPRPRRPDHRPPATPGERLETLDHVVARPRPGDAPHRRSGRSDRRSPGVMGGADVRGGRRARPTSSSSRRSSIRSASAGRRSATPFAPRRACASRRARSRGSRGSAPTARPASSPSGPAATSRRARSTRTRSSRRRAHRRVPAGPRQPAARDDVRDRRAARRSSPGSGSRPRRPRPAPRVVVAAGPRPLEVDPATDEVIDATSRPGGATSRSRPTSPRRSSASAATSWSRPGSRTRRCRRTGLDPLEVRDAVRETLAGAGLTEVVTSALVSPRDRRTLPARSTTAPSTANRSSGAVGRPVTVTNPLSSQHSVLRQSLLGSLLEVVSTNLRHGRDDVAIFEIGKGYGATGDGTTHEWWRLGFALTGAGRAAGLEPAGAAVRPRRRQGPRRADLPPPRLRGAGLRAAHRRPEPPSRPGGPRRRGWRPRRPGRRAPSGDRRGARPAGRAGRRRRARDRGPRPVASCADVRTAAAVTPSRSVERDLAVVVPSRRVRSASSRPRSARHGGPLLRDVALFDIYRGRPLERTEKSLAYRLTLRDDERTLTEAEVDAPSPRSSPASRPTSGPASGPDRSPPDRTGPPQSGPDHRGMRRWPCDVRISLLPLRRSGTPVRGIAVKEHAWTSGHSSAGSTRSTCSSSCTSWRSSCSASPRARSAA